MVIIIFFILEPLVGVIVASFNNSAQSRFLALYNFVRAAKVNSGVVRPSTMALSL